MTNLAEEFADAFSESITKLFNTPFFAERVENILSNYVERVELVKSEDVEDVVREEDIEDFVKKSEINTMIDEALDELDIADKITDVTDDIDWADKIKDAVDEGEFLERLVEPIDELITKKLTENGSELRNLITQIVHQSLKESAQEKASLDYTYSTLQVDHSMKAITTIFDELRNSLFGAPKMENPLP
jgi:hypothetical protein